jgi:hypothetical protein
METDRKIRTKFLIIGFGLQVLALLFAYLCLTFIPYIGWLPAFYLSPFIFLAGIIFIFFSRIRLIYKIACGFWILIVPISLTGEYYYQKQFIPREAYLIPQNYRGFVTVDFDRPDGSHAETENKVVVFRINADGRLKTTNRQKRLREDLEREREDYREYFYLDEAGNRTKLTTRRGLPEANSISNEISVTPYGSHYSDDNTMISQSEFFVGTPADFQKHFKMKYPN